MRSRLALALLALVIHMMTAGRAPACTTFIIRDDGSLIFGRNLDWITGAGLVIVNQRGVEKEGLPGENGEAPRWVSEYGSVTFNQVGKELPYGGVNEKGLVVEQMMLDCTEYPEPDGRPSLGVCQYIQYQLDNFATTAEVIASDSIVRISPESTPLHFLVLDAAGHAAAVEFLDGRMVCHTGDELPVEVLANSTYSESMTFLREGVRSRGNPSLRHFADAAVMVEGFEEEDDGPIVDYAFEVLNRVAQGPATRWSIVYDLGGMRIYFKTLDSPEIKSIDIGALDFECALPPQAMNIDVDTAGRVNVCFKEYSAEMNREVILEAFEAFRQHGFLDVPESDLIDLSAYPDGFECVER